MNKPKLYSEFITSYWLKEQEKNLIKHPRITRSKKALIVECWNKNDGIYITTTIPISGCLIFKDNLQNNTLYYLPKKWLLSNLSKDGLILKAN